MGACGHVAANRTLLGMTSQTWPGMPSQACHAIPDQLYSAAQLVTSLPGVPSSLLAVADWPASTLTAKPLAAFRLQRVCRGGSLHAEEGIDHRRLASQLRWQRWSCCRCVFYMPRVPPKLWRRTDLHWIFPEDLFVCGTAPALQVIFMGACAGQLAHVWVPAIPLLVAVPCGVAALPAALFPAVFRWVGTGQQCCRNGKRKWKRKRTRKRKRKRKRFTFLGRKRKRFTTSQNPNL
eukprot:352912-Chlamydomonas_euryale.AAC.1